MCDDLCVPLVGFKCPVTVPTADALNTFEHCIERCPHQCQPDFILAQIAHRETGNEHTGTMLSPSAFNACERELRLERTTAYHAEPEKLFFATRGALIHGFLENTAARPGVVREQRYYKFVPGARVPFYVSGRIDYFDFLKRRISDVKTMADKGLYIVYKVGYKEEHVWQLNRYRWLLAGGREETPDGQIRKWLEEKRKAGETVTSFDDAPGQYVNYEIDKLQVHYMMMNRVISTGTTIVNRVEKYKPEDVNYGRPYGVEVKRECLGVSPKGKETWDITLKIPDIPIFSFEKIEDDFRQRGPALVQALNPDEEYVPPGARNTPGEEWKCAWCHVREACDGIERKLAEANPSRVIPVSEIKEGAKQPKRKSRKQAAEPEQVQSNVEDRT